MCQLFHILSYRHSTISKVPIWYVRGMSKPASQCSVAHTQGSLRTNSTLIKLARKSCRNMFHIPIVGKKANINPLFVFVEGMKLRGAKTKVEYPESPTKDAKSKAVCYFISFLFVPYTGLGRLMGVIGLMTLMRLMTD